MIEVRQRHHPLVRIHLFGEFFVERLVSSHPSLSLSPRYERVSSNVWQSRGPAMTLLKVLLCRTRRRATKDELIETLWPDNNEIDVNHAFDSAASVLRKALKTHLLENVLITVRGPEGSILKLPDQHYLWVDADAFEETVSQAMKAERDGQDALPLWEAAQELLAGEFLEDNLYSAWSQARRQVLNAARHRCIHHLIGLYLAKDMSDQAETLLNLSLIDDPTDEDVLCRLLLLLEQQGRYQEAWQLYQQTAHILHEELHTAPSPRTQKLAERLHGGSVKSRYVPTTAVVSTSSDLPTEQDYVTIDNAYSEQLSSVSHGSAISELETHNMNPSRRKLLQQTSGIVSTALVAPHELLNLPLLERLSLALAKPSSIDETTLTYLEKRTANYYRDRHTAALSSHHLLGYVFEHLQRATTLLEGSPSPAPRMRLCSIAGEIAMLAGELCFDMRDYAHARNFHQLAIVAAQEANNNLLESIALGRMGFTWMYDGNMQAALPFLREARDIALKRSDVIVQAWLAVVEAEIQSHLGNLQACFKALDGAECIDQQKNTENDCYWIHFNRSLLEGYKGACLLRLSLSHPAENSLLQNAQEALIEALALLDPTMVRRQSTYLVDLAGVYAQQGEVEQASKSALEAIKITTQIKSGVILERLLTLRQNWGTWQDTSYMRNLDEQVVPLLKLKWYRGNV